MHRLSRVLLCLLCVPAFGCGGSQGVRFPSDQSGRVTVSQGIWGQVWLWKGNFMPGSASGTVTPARRTVTVYELTRQDQIVPSEGQGAFYTAIGTQPVASAESDDAGFFQLALPPGRYSLFVRENGLFYANLFDSEGHIFPLQVGAGQATKAQFDINYQAVY